MGTLRSQGPGIAALPVWPSGRRLQPRWPARPPLWIRETGHTGWGAHAGVGKSRCTQGEGGWSKDGKPGDRSVYVAKGQVKSLPSAGASKVSEAWAGWGGEQSALSCLFLKTSVRYNSHAIRLTHLKSTIQWSLYHHRVVQNHCQNPLWNIFIAPKRNPIPISSTSPFLPNPCSPDRGHHKSTLCLNTSAHSGYFYAWEHIICGLLGLASFTWLHGFMVIQNFSSYCRVEFQGSDLPGFVSFHQWMGIWASSISQLLGLVLLTY